jgi:hypothetical protein
MAHMESSKLISLETVNSEIDACNENCKMYGWKISAVEDDNQSFTVLMISPIDSERYHLHIVFDRYPQIPYLLDFIDPETQQIGTKHAYPKNKDDSFFHPNAVICHPCSRKSYAGYAGLHGDWQMDGWKKNAGGLININAILDAIYTRISNKFLYNGRLA